MFCIRRMDVGMTAPFDYLDGTAGEAIVAGEALTVTAGKATRCAATARPTYISVGGKDTNGQVPAVRVQPYMEFSTILSAAGGALTPGTAVTLSADGLSVTATTASGVATITGMEGTAVGDAVTVRF